MLRSDGKQGQAVVVGGSRLPFARAGGPYAGLSNQDMLTAVIDAVATRFDLAGQRLGEVAGGAVLKHARDRDLTRESVLGSVLAGSTPAYDVQQACGTGLETVLLVANKIALGQVDCGIAAGTDSASDAPIGLNDDLRRVLLEVRHARDLSGRLAALRRVRPSQVRPDLPANAEPRTGLSMGEHAAITAREWRIGRVEQDEIALASHHNLAAAYDRGFFDGLVTPFAGLARDQNLRPDTSMDRLAALPVVFGGAEGTMTAGNSTPLSDGASAVLLASREWAAQRGLPVLARVVDAEVAAVDFVNGPDGLLTAPVHAVPRLLRRNGLTLQDFDLYEIHEAFASVVLVTLRAWADPVFTSQRLGLAAPLGEIDRSRLNIAGSSLATGHPFAATGGRIVATLATLLNERGGGRGLISICAAGGQGVAMILEAD